MESSLLRIVLIMPESHRNTNCYDCMSACKVKLLRSSKIWDTLRQPMKQPRLDLNENAERLHYDLRKLIKEGNEKDLEHFAELLDAVVVNLTDANQEAELGSGSLYITLQRKFNKNLLAKYKQWVCDSHRTENVKTLREFINRESEFLTTASEAIADVLSGSKKERTLFAKEDPDRKKKHSKKCKVCKECDGLWTCVIRPLTEELIETT